MEDLIDYSNAQYNENGTIDCTWHHPVHGDIRFTADPDDVEEHGRMIYEFLKDKAEPYQSTETT